MIVRVSASLLFVVGVSRARAAPPSWPPRLPWQCPCLAGYGYAPSNISAFARFDEALRDLSNAMKYPRDVLAAREAYERPFAGVSLKTMRTWSLPHSGYYGRMWADDLTGSAIDGSGDLEGWSDGALREIATIGAVYSNTLFYVLYLLEEGVVKCENTWDQAWAYFAGSLQGEDGDSFGGGGAKGRSLFALAQKRCPQFGTCKTLTARSNEMARISWHRGRDGLIVKDCRLGYDRLRVIKGQIIVPLIQGVLRQAYEIDPAAKASNRQSERAEGWAYVYPLLPMVAACDEAKADILYRNMYLNADPVIPDGYVAVKDALESVYACLNVTCFDVGALVACGNRGISPCWNPCVDRFTEYFHGSTTDSEQKRRRYRNKAIRVFVLVIVAAGWLLAAYLLISLYRQRPFADALGFAASSNLRSGQQNDDPVAAT